MDLIYGSASVTIIASSGISAEAGLPGVKQDSRRRVQEPFVVKGIQLIETLDPNGNGEAGSYVGESVWNERGWTFQERLLSRRALVFTDEQVYWECRKAFWSEDSYREFASVPTIYRHSIDDEFPRQPLNAETEGFERLYRIFVEKYSGRLFTKRIILAVLPVFYKTSESSIMNASYGVCQNPCSVVHLLGPARLRHLPLSTRRGLVCIHLNRLTVYQ